MHRIWPPALRPCICVLPLLAACTSTVQPSPFSTRAPSLQVGAVALQSGVPQIALAVARRRLATDRNDLQGLLMQGQALAALGDRAGALESDRAAATVAPGSADAQLALGRGLLASGQVADAEAALRRAAAIAPTNEPVRCDLGVALDLQGRHQEAQAQYRAVLAAAPGQQAALVDLGLSMALTGKAGAAVALLQPMGSTPGASARVRQDLAVALTIDGHPDDAQRLLQTDLSPDQSGRAIAAYAEIGSREEK